MKKINKVIISICLIMSVLLISPARTEAATVKLNKSTVTIAVGETYALKVTGTKSKATWSTNRKNIATVNNKGVVTGKKTGAATITAKVGNKKYTCKVWVKTAFKASQTMYVGDTYTLKYNGNSVKSWKANNSNVKLKVSSNRKSVKITANKAGTTTVTCTNTNGKKYTCKITVKALSIPKEVNLCKGTIGKTITIKLPTDATPSISFCSSCFVARIANGNLVIEQYAAVKENEVINLSVGSRKYRITVKCVSSHSNRETSREPGTCTENGKINYECTICKSTSFKLTEPLGHDYEVTQIPSTCSTDGATVYTCRRCGNSYQETINASHTFVEDGYLTPCAENDWKNGKKYKCSVCGETGFVDCIKYVTLSNGLRDTVHLIDKENYICLPHRSSQLRPCPHPLALVLASCLACLFVRIRRFPQLPGGDW